MVSCVKTLFQLGFYHLEYEEEFIVLTSLLPVCPKDQTLSFTSRG